MKPEIETITPDSGDVSRREFLVGAGATAGALAAIGSVAGLAHSPAAEAALSSRKYYSYQVAFELDGQYAGLLIAAEGGEPVIVMADTAVGALKTTSAIAGVRYEPLTLALADMSKAMYDWIDKTLKGAATGRSASVITATQDLKETYRLEMRDARLTEVMLDNLDVQSRVPARFNVKIAPGSSSHLYGGTGILKSMVLKAKSPLQSNFAFYIQGLETTTARVRTVESIGLRQRPDGILAPLPLKFGLALQDAGPLYQWMNETLAGKAGPRAGELRLMSADLTRVVSSVTFEQLTVMRVSAPAQSGSDVVQQVEVECQPAGVRFNLGELLT